MWSHRDFLELREQYQSVTCAKGGGVLLDLQAPVNHASKSFMDKLLSRKRPPKKQASPRHKDNNKNNNNTVQEELMRARTVLKAIDWIQDVLSGGALRGQYSSPCSFSLPPRIQALTFASLFTADWARLRHDELSTGELCDTAYMLGNVVR